MTDTPILGISAFYHDAAACLVRGSTIVAAAQEERFTREKHDRAFPANAIRYCLDEGGLTAADLEYVAFYEKPLRRFERLIETYVTTAPLGVRSFTLATGAMVNEKLAVPRLIDEGLGGDFTGPILFPDHHESHAASAFFPSPFERAAIITADGVGEWTTTSIGIGEGNQVRMLREIRFPHSLGLLYSAFTYYTGFRVNSGEYKLMGLAPYGQPRFRDVILDELIDLRPDGSFRLNMRYFDYCAGLRMTNSRFDKLFGGPPRRPGDPIDERHMDVAASVQSVVEEAVLRLAHEARRLTGEQAVCLAGGVALNCVANGRVLREGPFEDIWIQPAAGDAGGAVGAALAAWHVALDNPRTAVAGDAMQGARLGPAYGDDEVHATLRELGAVFEAVDEDAALTATAAMLAEGQVVGWFQGRMEFGPRALGGRSILADPRDPGVQSLVNRKIKYRESFRPFAPVVRRERCAEYFDLTSESPYMLLVAHVAESQRLETDTAAGEDTTDIPARLRRQRSTIPAVTHVDYSARVQTCDRERDPRLHALLGAWEEKSGCGVLLNTSFNVRGEPIVCTPGDAYRCFMATEMDALVIGNTILRKDDQPAFDTGDRTFAPD